MEKVNVDFKRHFQDFEEWFLTKRSDINSHYATDDCINDELLRTTYSEMTNHLKILGECSYSLDIREQEAGKKHVLNSSLYRYIQESPYYWQIIKKPRGYAGDAEMMNIIYRHEYEGKTPFSKLFHKASASVEACQAVRNRRRFLTEEINKVQVGNILSFAAGPAQEILDLKEHDTLTPGRRYLAIDHDISTLRDASVNKSDNLNYALGNAFQLMKGEYRIFTPRKRFYASCDPTKDMKGLRKFLVHFKYKVDTLKNRKFSLVYSAGLFDYIKTFPEDTKGTTALTKNLFNLVEPGGELIIGNFSPTIPIGTRWMMEYVCDWQLIYRGKEELMNFTKSINKGQVDSVEVTSEPTGINLFLKVKKRS
ncbi:hypothetical protein ACFS7Z_19870 [Pontibacter toksunensis]|uniref:Class I SAM-dependent methyltransferase n=1 Tax=Pontibacter toksunensis TaxID=1332631 RepID=A0ABW6BXT6_9BACT